jgi:hypothetical protein
MPATTDLSGPAPRYAKSLRVIAVAAGAAVLALAGFAAADSEPSSNIYWHSPEGLAGVESYRLDFLGAAGLAPLAAPMRPAARTRNVHPVTVVPFEATRAPEAAAAPQARDRNVRPVATNPLGGIDQSADRGVGGRSYSLFDAVRDADWRKATARRLRSLTPSHTAF